MVGSRFVSFSSPVTSTRSKPGHDGSLFSSTLLALPVTVPPLVESSSPPTSSPAALSASNLAFKASISLSRAAVSSGDTAISLTFSTTVFGSLNCNRSSDTLAPLLYPSRIPWTLGSTYEIAWENFSVSFARNIVGSFSYSSFGRSISASVVIDTLILTLSVPSMSRYSSFDSFSPT